MNSYSVIMFHQGLLLHYDMLLISESAAAMERVKTPCYSRIHNKHITLSQVCNY